MASLPPEFAALLGEYGQLMDIDGDGIPDVAAVPLPGGNAMAANAMMAGMSGVGGAKITRQAGMDRLRVEHTQLQYVGKGVVSSVDVWLVTSKRHLGGEREWFECPRCRRPCRVL